MEMWSTQNSGFSILVEEKIMILMSSSAAGEVRSLVNKYFGSSQCHIHQITQNCQFLGQWLRWLIISDAVRMTHCHWACHCFCYIFDRVKSPKHSYRLYLRLFSSAGLIINQLITLWKDHWTACVWWLDNLAPNNLAPDNLAPGQFGTRTIWHRKIWHQDNLAPNMWYD